MEAEGRAPNPTTLNSYVVAGIRKSSVRFVSTQTVSGDVNRKSSDQLMQYVRGEGALRLRKPIPPFFMSHNETFHSQVRVTQDLGRQRLISTFCVWDSAIVMGIPRPSVSSSL